MNDLPTPEAPTPGAPTPGAKLATVSRTCKVEVVFPNLRAADRTAVYDRLWGTMDDLRAAANRTVGVLWMLKTGTLPWPEEAPARKPSDPVRKVPLSTLRYRAFSGAWQPTGSPLYVAKSERVAASSDVRNEASAMVEDRLTTDFFDVSIGQKSLPTFRSIPLGIPAKRVSVIDPERFTIRLPIWTGGAVTVRPRFADDSQITVLRRCAAGAYKLGSVRLIWDKPPGRKGKWFLAVSYTMPRVVRDNTSDLTMGIDIGIRLTFALALVKPDGSWLPVRPVVQLPDSARRGWDRHRRELHERQRLASTRQDASSRLTAAGDRLARTVDTALRQSVAAVFREVDRRGIGTIVIEDHKDWSVSRAMDNTEGQTRKQAARARVLYFRWHQGRLRQLFEQGAEKRGIVCKVVDPAMSSRTCPKCGVVHARTGVYAPEGATDDVKAIGRVTLDQFVCPCGFRGQADWTAAINLARVALGVTAPPEPKKPAKPKRVKPEGEKIGRRRVAPKPAGGAP